MTTSKKKISNKTSLFFEENKQRLSNAKQRLWNFEKGATSPSFTVLLIKHNECISDFLQNLYFSTPFNVYCLSR